MDIALIALFGLIVGSFLNAVLYRLSVNDSAFRGRSYCPACRHVLAPRDLIPLLSYLFLHGKCRHCKVPISLQYPVIEAVTGFAFIAVYVYFGQSFGLRAGLYMVYTGFLILIFAYDLMHYLILDSVILLSAIVTFIGNLLLGVSWSSMLIAGSVTAGFFAAQFVLSRGRWIGGGDIRLGFLMGVMLGWPVVLAALFISYVAGSIIGVGLIAFGKKTLQSKVPFGTFLTAATFVSLFWGQELITWYLGKLGL
ncbi:MAG: prepilin peptidase [Candidatus Komeilibacteria bacterium]|nr:prepilin peptidase [Candidatus Komeilibacteria bacterium]